MKLGDEIITGLDQAITFEKLFPKPTFIMMIGLPGSGKSTVAKELAEIGNAKIFSSDEYRAKLLGDENDQSNNELVFNTLYNDLCYEINNGNNVIFDATNISLKSRHKALDRLPKYCKSYQKIAYVVNTNYDLCVINDKSRDRSVGEFVIKKFLHQYQCPQKFEGFDQIIFHSQRYSSHPSVSETERAYWSSKMHLFTQCNPHHLYTVGKHCDLLAEQCDENDDIRREAGYFHDIGKLLTQHIDDNGVAHYYNHDSVGAYIISCNPEILTLIDWDDILEAIFYINFHMRAHRDFCGAKAERKYRNLFGDRLFNNLMQFAEWDRIASGTYKN